MTAALLIGGIGSLLFGLAESFWIARAKMSRVLIAQGIIFAELGILFIAMALMPTGPARIGVAIVGVLAIASSALMQQKFVREERETRESQ